MGKCLLGSGQSTRRLLYKQMIFLQPQLLAPCSQKLEKVLFHCVHDVVYFCSTCGTECWEASSIKTTGPEKECAFVSSPRWTREFPSFARSARAGRLGRHVTSFLKICVLPSPRFFSRCSLLWSVCLTDMEPKAWLSIKLFLIYVTSWGTPLVR